MKGTQKHVQSEKDSWKRNRLWTGVFNHAEPNSTTNGRTRFCHFSVRRLFDCLFGWLFASFLFQGSASYIPIPSKMCTPDFQHKLDILDEAFESLHVPLPSFYNESMLVRLPGQDRSALNTLFHTLLNPSLSSSSRIVIC